jgi:thioesterase domain-containing protein
MDINSGEDALMQELARKAAAVIRRDWPGQPVCLFGHCLGSALAWAVTVELRRDQSTAVELVLCDPWLERERKMRTPPGKWRGRFLAYRSAWRYWRDSRTGNDSRYFWTFVRNQWEDRKLPRIDLDASSAFYVGALRHYDFGPILSGNLRLVRNRREARLFAPVAWSAKVNGDVTTTFFESGHTHSLKEIGAKVIRAMSS